VSGGAVQVGVVRVSQRLLHLRHQLGRTRCHTATGQQATGREGGEGNKAQTSTTLHRAQCFDNVWQRGELCMQFGHGLLLLLCYFPSGTNTSVAGLE
jgi:hypothetical protein